MFTLVFIGSNASWNEIQDNVSINTWSGLCAQLVC